MSLTSDQLAKIKLCTQRFPPTVNRSTIPGGNLEEAPGGPPSLSMDWKHFWPNGSRLRVAFLPTNPEKNKDGKPKSQAGTPFMMKKVKQFAEEWEKLCNIDIDFDNPIDPDIRISFSPGGSWSYVGRWCRSDTIAKDEPTMNFGWFDDNTSDEEFSRTVLHEFGHAIGCCHELQQPMSKIPWNKEVVYQYYKQNDGWDAAKVDDQVLKLQPAKDARYTSFDPSSIMCYPVQTELTTGGFSIPFNTRLSDMDKTMIRLMYPPPTRGKGSFSTSEVRKDDSNPQENAGYIQFSPEYFNPPKIALGINEFDTGCLQNIRAGVSVDRLTGREGVVHANTWGDSVLYLLSCTWMEARYDDDELQVGDFNTNEVRPWMDPQLRTSKRINFALRSGSNPSPMEFPAKPVVQVFLTGTDLDRNHYWRVNAYVTDVDRAGFTINYDTWDDTIVYSGRLSWVAHSADRAGVFSGHFTTGNSWPNVQLKRQGYISFPPSVFNKAPRVMIALQGFDFGNRKNLRIKVWADDVTEHGFTWHAESWHDSLFFEAKIAYIAFGATK